MKTKTFFFFAVIVITVIVLSNARQVRAQAIPALISENNIATTSSSVAHTGCDKMKTGVGVVNVMVCDGSNPVFAWDNPYVSPSTGNIPLLYSDAVDPDVALTTETGSNLNELWALVAYYSPSQNNVYLDCFYWDHTTSVFTYVTTYQLNANPTNNPSAINIDATLHGDFVAVWENTNHSPIIETIGGNITSGTVALGTLTSVTSGGATGGNNYQPDVTIAYNGSGNDDVYYTYIYSNQRVAITQEVFSNVYSGGTLNSTAIYQYAPTCSHCAAAFPRITTLGELLGYSGREWAIAFEVSDGSSIYDIISVNNLVGGGPYVVNLTNNGYLVKPLDNVPNNHPTIDCDNYGQCSHVTVAWTNDNSTNNAYANSVFSASLSSGTTSPCTINNTSIGSCSPLASCLPSSAPGACSTCSQLVMPIVCKYEATGSATSCVLYNGCNPPTYYWEYDSNPLVYYLASTNVNGTTAPAVNEYEVSIAGAKYAAATYLLTWYDNWNLGTLLYKKFQEGYPIPNLRLTSDNNTTNNNGNVFPNPFTDELKVNFDFDYAQVSVYDITGKILLNAFGNEARINSQLNAIAKNLSQGIYLLKIEPQNNGEVTNQKLIKM
jgi:hypothetical protein